MGNHWATFGLCTHWDDYTKTWVKSRKVILSIDNVESVTDHGDYCLIRTRSGDGLEVVGGFEDVTRIIYKAGGKEIE